MSDSLRPHGLQHARLPCPSLSPGVCINSCALSQWCYLPSHPLSLPFSFAINLRQFQIFSNELPQVAKYWSFSCSISPSEEYSEFISFRIAWFFLLVVQRILKSLFQHHNSKASIFSALSPLYGPNLISVYDYWKSHSFDCTVLCQQSDIFAT